MADKIKKSKTLRILFLVLAVPTAVAYGYLAIVPFDITHKIPELREKIKGNLYGDINASTLSIKFLPRPKIIATTFVLSSKSAPVIEAKKMSATVKLIPLIIKRIVIKELVFDEAEFFVIKRADGTINLKEVRKEKLLDIRLRGAKLKSAKLRVTNELPNETFQFELSDLSAKLYPTSGGYTYIAEGSGPKKSIIKISGDAGKVKEKWRFGGTMSAEGLEAVLFAPYIRSFDPEIKVLGTIKADLDFSYNNKATIKGSIDYRTLEVTVPKFHLDGLSSTAGITELDLTWSPDEINVALNNATLKADGFDLLGSFSLSGPKEKRTIRLNLSTTPGEYFKIKRLVPYKLFSKKVKERIEEFDVRAGKVRIDELKINALMSELKGSTLLKDSESFTMKLDFEAFDFKYINFNDQYSNVWGRLSFAGDDIELTNFNGLYGKAKIEKLGGLISGLTKKVTYRLNISSSLELDESLNELKRLARGSLDKVSGSGPISLTLHLSGGDGKRLDYMGKVTFQDTTLSHSSIPIERFTSTRGSVGFEKNMLVFNDISTMSGGSKLAMNGTIEGLSDTAPFYNLNLKGAIESVGLNSLLKGRVKEPVNYTNLLFYECVIKGTLDDLAIDTTLDLTDIDIAYRNIIKKKKGFPVLMKLEARANKDEARIKKALFNIGSSNFSISGKIKLNGDSYELEIPHTRLKLKDLDSVLTALEDDEWASGLVDLTLKAKRSGKTGKILLNGEVSLTDGFLSTAAMKARLEDIKFKALLSGNTADIRLDNLTMGKSSASGHITIKDLNRRVVEFELNSDYLNTDDLLPREDNTKSKKKKKKSTLTGTGRINIKKGQIKKHSFKAFKTKVLIDKEAYNIDSIIFSMSEGLVTGKATVIKNPKAKKLYTAKLLVRKVDLETLTKELGKEKKIISGKLDANIDLFGKRGVPIKEGLGGTMILDTRRGRLWKLPVITKIFSLVNIISINSLFEAGLEYNKIKGNFDIKDGVFYTEDLVLDSSSLRMSVIGEIDYPKDSIDAALGFHPFVTMDKIINLIPLAGWIISGKDRNSVTMYYEIKGSLKDPDVHAVPVKSLGKGIFGILERTLTLPIQVLAPNALKEDKNKDEGAKEPEETAPKP